MTATFLMIVLTLTSGGQLSAAFSSAPTEADCLVISKSVETILKQAGYKIERIGCFKSAQSFSPYEHGAPDNTPRQIYLVSIEGNEAKVTQKDTMASCRSVSASIPQANGTAAYCATSIQTLVK